MPWHVAQSTDCPESKPWAVIKDADGEIEGCHETEDAAKQQMAALYANEDRSVEFEHPRANLVRSLAEAPSVERAEADASDGRIGTLTGQFARYSEWAEIDSLFEGHFLERFNPGAFARTIKNNLGRMKVLLEHGQDPVVGNKSLGPIESLEDEASGVRYVVPLIDTSYNRDLVPALDAGLYGSSMRFEVVTDEWEHEPKRTEFNPDGLPQRSVNEAKVLEFGPVTFPAYVGASAGLRSDTDRFLLEPFMRDPERFTALLESLRTGQPLPSAPASKGTAQQDPAPTPSRLLNDMEWTQWLTSLT